MCFIETLPKRQDFHLTHLQDLHHILRPHLQITLQISKKMPADSVLQQCQMATQMSQSSEKNRTKGQ